MQTAAATEKNPNRRKNLQLPTDQFIHRVPTNDIHNSGKYV
jgi:hypothetical protein